MTLIGAVCLPKVSGLPLSAEHLYRTRRLNREGIS